jgi:uncharacterized protein (TIRG00374 family)
MTDRDRQERDAAKAPREDPPVSEEEQEEKEAQEQADLDGARLDEGMSLLQDRKKIALALAGIILVIVAIYVLLPKVVGLGDVLHKFDDAAWYWVVAAVAANILAFGAYVMIFRAVISAASERVRRRLDVRTSYDITMAGLAATRLFSAAGAGGLILTYWALARAGMARRQAVARMIAFLVVLYSVYLVALIVFGLLLDTGVLPGNAPFAGTLLPAAIAGGVLIVLGLMALIPEDLERRLENFSRGYRRQKLAHWAAQLAKVPATVSVGIRTAFAYLRYPRRGALAIGGAIGFWGANIAILWCSFEAFGGSVPLAVLVQGFFVGMTANLLPSPAGGVGAVDAGMIGAFLLFGEPSSEVFPAVLAYRVIAFWLPIPPGIVAYVQLRKKVAGWRAESASSGYTIESKVMTEAK